MSFQLSNLLLLVAIVAASGCSEPASQPPKDDGIIEETEPCPVPRADADEATGTWTIRHDSYYQDKPIPEWEGYDSSRLEINIAYETYYETWWDVHESGCVSAVVPGGEDTWATIEYKSSPNAACKWIGYDRFTVESGGHRDGEIVLRRSCS